MTFNKKLLHRLHNKRESPKAMQTTFISYRLFACESEICFVVLNKTCIRVRYSQAQQEGDLCYHPGHGPEGNGCSTLTTVCPNHKVPPQGPMHPAYPSLKSSTLSFLIGDSVVCLCCCCADDELVDLFRIRLNLFEPFNLARV